MKQTIKINESDLRRMIAESVKGVIMEMNEGGGYDMDTPEGREGARKWMSSMMSQEDPTGGYADRWVSDNAPNYPDISWDDCYEHMKKAFIAGVEYARNN